MSHRMLGRTLRASSSEGFTVVPDPPTPRNELDRTDVLTEADALQELLVSSSSIREAGLHPVAVLGKARWFRRDDVEALATSTWGSLRTVERIRREREAAGHVGKGREGGEEVDDLFPAEGRPIPFAAGVPYAPPFGGGEDEGRRRRTQEEMMGRGGDGENGNRGAEAGAGVGGEVGNLPFSMLRRLVKQRKRREEKQHMSMQVPMKPTKSMSKSASTVYAAMAGNVLIMAGKIVAFMASGSGAMLSEAMHSAADVANQSLLVIGMKRAKRDPDKRHPYGYAREAYIWALISGVGTFFLGAGVATYHGIDSILHPPTLTELPFSLAMLGTAFVVESATLLYAARIVAAQAAAANRGFLSYVVDGAHPMSVAVLVEDSAAVTGVVIAGAAITASYLTGNPLYDSIGTLTVGALMAGCAAFIIRRNMRDLVGKAMPKKSQDQIMSLLEADKAVVAVHKVKAVLMGTDEIRFKAEIDFDGRQIAKHLLRARNVDLAAIMSIKDEKEMEAFLIKYGDDVIEQLADEVDRIEREIARIVPEARYIDLEAH